MIFVCVCFYFFFFSSRRRHTRFDCDWSSDVCSSDLIHNDKIFVKDWRTAKAVHARKRAGTDQPLLIAREIVTGDNHFVARSEERREGKSVDLGGRRIIKKKKKNERF